MKEKKGGREGRERERERKERGGERKEIQGESERQILFVVNFPNG